VQPWLGDGVYCGYVFIEDHYLAFLAFKNKLVVL
jgi:hypothetical protein